MSLDTYTHAFLALVAVVALMLIFAWLLRRYGLGARSLGRGGRRLVLLRRDDTEHLVLLGAQSELLIESGIKQPAAPESFSTALRETRS